MRKMHLYILDKLLSLDVGHTVNTGDTITTLIVRKKYQKSKKAHQSIRSMSFDNPPSHASNVDKDCIRRCGFKEQTQL